MVARTAIPFARKNQIVAMTMLQRRVELKMRLPTVRMADWRWRISDCRAVACRRAVAMHLPRFGWIFSARRRGDKRQPYIRTRPVPAEMELFRGSFRRRLRRRRHLLARQPEAALA